MARQISVGFELGGDELRTLTGSTIQSTTKRSGGYALQCSSLASGTRQGAGIQLANGAANIARYFRFYFRVDTLPSADNVIWFMTNSDGNLSSTQIVKLSLSSTGTLILADEDGAIGSPSSALSLSTWYRIEVFTDRTTNNVAGPHTATARIDGVEFASDSARAWSAGIRSWVVGANLSAEAQTTGNWYFDDIAIDSTYWCGEGSVEVIFPTGTDNDSGWTPTSGSDYQMVDDWTTGAADGTTTNLTSNTLNELTEFSLTNTSSAIASDSVINLVEVWCRGAGTNASDVNASFKTTIRASSGGTREDLASAIKYSSTTQKTNTRGSNDWGAGQKLLSLPGSSGIGWTKSDLDSAVIGLLLSTTNTSATGVTAMALVIDYSPAPASMTASIPTPTTFTTSVTSMAVNMPSPFSSGDLLLAFCEVRNSGTWTVPTDWTEFVAQVGGGGSVGELTGFYKIADGTESDTATWTASVATTAVWHTITIKNWHGTTPPEATSTNGDSSSANPPSLTPSWGAEDTLWIVVGGHTAGSATAFTSAPTNYTDYVTTGGSSGGSAVAIATAYRTLNASSEDPGTFTVSNNRFWAALTVGIRPAAAGGATRRIFMIS